VAWLLLIRVAAWEVATGGGEHRGLAHKGTEATAAVAHNHRRRRRFWCDGGG